MKNTTNKSPAIHCVAGLPRSGSSLLCNILAQNSSFHVTPTNGIVDLIVRVRNQWNEIESFNANPDNDARIRVMKNMLYGFHKPHKDKVVFDKSRGWLHHIALLEKLIGKKAKVLVTVRDLRDVLASFEKLWRLNSERLLSQEKQFPVDFQTVEGRCKIWADASQIVGSSFNSIKDALARGYGDRMHFVKYEELTVNPHKVLKDIYGFLGEDNFNHDFDNVVQVLNENDEVGYGIPNLHTIRSKVEYVGPQWHILGKCAEIYAGQECW